ncbi:PEP/pyruvate-binding domain-containing protein [Nonlabens xiamenensis]|uniref:PEP/pyruvate-binding domain-containing protein n=1 Tax=Nonlabens xiamenensis TaxID=2341043 RepID=UPI000F610799|nr:PEP/pyruvate-binding domain-containing protein [Nonlabens xiamenensis]
MKRFLLLIPIFFSTIGLAQQFDDARVKEMIAQFRQLDRGPYKSINWFCPDGSVREARDPCPDAIGEGIQHASYKPEIKALAETRHLYFSEILASNKVWGFWDGNNNHSRVKQYQLNKYLEAVDNGWIQEKSRFYRGAKQIEDEEEWGRKFYYTILSDNDLVERDFFLIRESLRDLPHDGDTNLAQEIRSLSKVLAQKHPKFMDLRIKIHGNPQAQDINAVKEWLDKNESDLSESSKKDFNQLLSDMQDFFEPVAVSELEKMVADWPEDTYIRSQAEWFSNFYKDEKNPSILVPAAANLMCDIRVNLKEDLRGTRRTNALELSLRLEELIFQQASQWEPVDLQEHLDKIYALSEALASAGYTELWEWDAVEDQLYLAEGRTIEAHQLLDFINTGRSQVEWGTGMVNAIYGDVVNEYMGFEPLAYGFYDDRIRSSLLLPLGDAVGSLGGLVSRQIGLTSEISGVDNVSTVRGLNPGYTKGKLVVVEGNAEGMNVNPNHIYIFDHPPSDLKPVAGIATVAEGNLVSHVQLLARNLGIPNAAISTDNLADLKALDGEEIFYAVSNRGTVVLKPSDEMSDLEQSLFSQTKKKEKKTIHIPEDKLKLDGTLPLNMAEVGSKDSGILCGPKAANLGQLKQMFPNNVVNGIVIPFGVFKDHMNQPMPETSGSYWDFLMSAFAKAKQMRSQGTAEQEVVDFQLKQLSQLREAIATMPFKKNFVDALEADFNTVLGDRLGNVPVFLRSDTNMEDLEEFTGAGLNLTVFNAVARKKVMNGIRDVWASPYTERSFKWRQAYLDNPENVYPSILIIPTVDVDYSGVLITKDFINNDDNKITLAMSRGAGGAVDGQSAETYLINKEGEGQLISPARENQQRKLPITGGSVMEQVDFDQPILNAENLKTIREFAVQVHETMPGSKDGSYTGAWDIELGFKDGQLYLFQIRPFVENSQAQNSEYLNSIDADVDVNTKLLLHKEIAL